MVKVRLERQMKNLTLFSEEPEAMQGFKQMWQQKGVLSGLPIRKITGCWVERNGKGKHGGIEIT